MSRLLPLTLCFLASGFAALVYEVIWIRILSLTLSVTVYSLTTVLCAFMTGLALGAGVSSAIGDRLRRPLVVFGLAELGIAVCGVAAPSVLFGLGDTVASLYAALGGSGPAFSAARFGLVFGLLVIPCTLMGATLPLLSRAVVDRPGVAGRGTGALYAANTFGAVAGCVAAGFWLIPGLGLQATSQVAAAVNVSIGVVALVWGLRAAPLAMSERHSATRANAPLGAAAWTAGLVYGVSGFTAMGYEVLWTRALEHFTHNSTYAYTAMLAMFLLGLASGSALLSRFADRLRRPLLAIGVVQAGVGASVVLALVVYMRFETWVPALAEAAGGITSFGRVVVMLFAETTLTMALTTFLLGAMFPLVTRVAVDSVAQVARRVGAIYVLNTLGSILGSLLVGFLLLPELGVRSAFLALVGLNLAVAAWLGVTHLASRSGRALVTGALAIGAIGLALIPSGLFERQFARRYGELLFYREEVTDTIMVTEKRPGQRWIRYSDGRGTAGTITADHDRMLAHIPLMLHPHPRSVLQIAFGVGNSLAGALFHPLQRVDCVELSPGVIDAAPYFASTNLNSLADPRVTLTIEDGRNFLLTRRDEQYDVIRLDPPELHTRGVVNLYTREFYELARARLAPGGVFSVWINVLMTPWDDLRSLVRTMDDVFPHVSIWHTPDLHSWVINGSVAPHSPDWRRLEQAFAIPEVARDLAARGIPDPYHFLAYHVMSDGQVRSWADDAPPVVDDHTRVDFSLPRSRDSFYGIANSNTDHWLVQQMDAEAGRGSINALVVNKLIRLLSVKQPLPELRGVIESGQSASTILTRVEEAQESTRRKLRTPLSNDRRH